MAREEEDTFYKSGEMLQTLCGSLCETNELKCVIMILLLLLLLLCYTSKAFVCNVLVWKRYAAQLQTSIIKVIADW